MSELAFFLLGASFGTLVLGELRYRIGRESGLEEGYAKAREIPIGYFERVHLNAGGMTGIIRVADDVNLVPGEPLAGVSIGFNHRDREG